MKSPGASLEPYRPVDTGAGTLIRVGRENDGGYVLPSSAIQTCNVLLSLGVNDDWSFEEHALKHNPALRIICVDGSTGLRRVVTKALQKAVDMVGYLASGQWEKLRRNARYLRTPIRFQRFFSKHELIRRMVVASNGPGQVTLAALFEHARLGLGRPALLLKVDIEGGEYDVLPLTQNQMDCVNVLLVEFHALDQNWSRFERCMASLSTQFVVAHLHGNNFGGVIPGTGVPVALEVTLVNRRICDAARLVPLTHAYPVNGLDMPNNWQREDLKLAL